MAGRKQILIEGFTPKELVRLDELEQLTATGNPLVFRAGSAEILAQFSKVDDVLEVELAVVDQGGEGVLPMIVETIEAAARVWRCAAVEWTVYAANCATPNPKLIKVLERLGFERRGEAGSAYFWRRLSTNASLLRRPTR